MRILFAMFIILAVWGNHISKANADININACTLLMKEMASSDLSDDTGSISTAYDCENGLVIVSAHIYPHISPVAVTKAKDSFIDNYCLVLSKNYLLSDNSTQTWLEIVYRGGVQYNITHVELKPIVIYKPLDDCLKYVQMMESILPENPYEQTKFIRKYNPKN